MVCENLTLGQKAEWRGRVGSEASARREAAGSGEARCHERRPGQGRLGGSGSCWKRRMNKEHGGGVSTER